MPKTPLTKARRDTRYYGLYSKSATSVSPPASFHFPQVYSPVNWAKVKADCSPYVRWIGSRYIYDLYYEKEAISKKLYDWLLKNGYADANLIAKWKKQGYEKVRLRTGFLTMLEGIKLMLYSCVVYDAFRQRKLISTLLVYVVFRRRSWRKTREYSVWAAVVAVAVVVIETNFFILRFWLGLGLGLGRDARMDRQTDRRVWRHMSVLSFVYADARNRVWWHYSFFFFLFSFGGLEAAFHYLVFKLWWWSSFLSFLYLFQFGLCTADLSSRLLSLDFRYSCFLVAAWILYRYPPNPEYAMHITFIRFSTIIQE